MTDRAVSDTLGFVFVFAIIISTVGLTLGLGLSGLEDTRDAERLTNAERAFDVLADNFDRLVDSGAPSRATEVKLSDSQVSLVDPITVTVSADGSAIYGAETQPVEYQSDGGEKLMYVNGAIVRSGAGGAIILREPGFVFGPERTLVPVVEVGLADGSSTGVGGSTTVLVRGERVSRTVLVNSIEEPDYNVSVRMETRTEAHAEAWRRYFVDRGLTCSDPAGGDVACWRSTERVYVQVVRVELAFE